MVRLRDGSKVKDARLARLVQFDKRSRKYAIRAAIGAKRPRSFTWSCDKWLDQGVEGACVGFSMTHELAARPAPVTRGMTPTFAREKVYWEVLEKYEVLLKEKGSSKAFVGGPPRAERWTGSEYPRHSMGFINHTLWMLGEIRTFVSEGRREKVMRWLGFVQGSLWHWGFRTVEEMKKDNMPDEEKVDG